MEAQRVLVFCSVSSTIFPVCQAIDANRLVLPSPQLYYSTLCAYITALILFPRSLAYLSCRHLNWKRPGASIMAASPPAPSSTRFFGSQVGGKSVINYSYTDLPWKLLAFDAYYFFRFAWAIPYILLPADLPGSGPLGELTPTPENIFCIAVHFLLCVLQLGFIVCLIPLAVLLPVWAALLVVGGFLVLNSRLCRLLNGTQDTYTSSPEFSPAENMHPREQWIFLNGVAAGQHWLQNNLDRLALTFRRPILGIHNRTDGIIFDIIECLVQRSFGYATGDVRLCYAVVKEKLYDKRYEKVVFILHSQGGIEGGMVLDWLLQELPQDLLAKLEVYTFGNAANHFNNPHRQVVSQAKKAAGDACAVADNAVVNGVDSHPTGSSVVAASTSTNGNGAAASTSPSSPSSSRRPPPSITTDANGGAPPACRQQQQQQQQQIKQCDDPASLLRRETTSSDPASVTGRAIGHVEHFAHTTDFVALWGVLHFATSAPATASMPRFIGQVFVRSSPRGGHQFCHHYLDGMFPLKRAGAGQEEPRGAARGRWWGWPWRGMDRAEVAAMFSGGCAKAGAGEGLNDFMDSEVVVGREGDEGTAAREAWEGSWIGVFADGLSDSVCPSSSTSPSPAGDDGIGEVTVHSSSPILGRRVSALRRSNSRGQVVKVEELSRLWKYRDGMCPGKEAPQNTDV